MNNKVENPKKEVPNTTEMNDRDYLNEILEIEKNMSVNFTTALNEVSNKKLYTSLFPLFKDIKGMQRELYNLIFKKGWYSLEKAEEQKIDEKLIEMNAKMNELS